MNLALNIPSVLFALIGVYIVFLNYSSLFCNRLNKRRGIKQHSSLGYILPQFSLLLAYTTSFLSPVRFVPGRLRLVIGVVDPSLWCLIALPFILVFTHKRQ